MTAEALTPPRRKDMVATIARVIVAITIAASCFVAGGVFQSLMIRAYLDEASPTCARVLRAWHPGQ
jgi:hypothetical protein